MKQEKKKPTISKEQQEKVDILNKYNDMIESIKWLLFTWLRYEEKEGLIYHEAYFNIWEKVSRTVIEEKIQQASDKIDSLMGIEKDVENESILNNAQKNLIKEYIRAIINQLEYHKNAIYIEWEKAWLELTKEERDIYNKRKLALEQEMFGDPITKLEFRKNKVLEKLKELYNKFPQDKLSEGEKMFRIKKITPLLSNEIKDEVKDNTEKEEPDIYVSEKAIFPLIETLLQIEGFKNGEYIKIEFSKNKEITNVEMKEDDLFVIPASWKSDKIYEYFKDQGLWQKFKIIKKNAWNNLVDITKEGNDFKKNEISLSPAENGKYNITKKVLPIIFEHETSTHVKTWIGNFDNIYIMDPNRWPLEEGVAMANQQLSISSNLDKVYETSVWDVGQLLWETFDDADLEQAVSIYYKISWNKDRVIDRVRRIRMGIPKWDKGARRADLVYGDAKVELKKLEELTKTPDGIKMLNRYAKLIYSTKLWSKSINNIDEILEWIIDVETLEPNFPIFAGKIIYWKLFKGKLDTNKMLENDIRSLITVEDKKQVESWADSTTTDTTTENATEKDSQSIEKSEGWNTIKVYNKPNYDQKRLLIKILNIIKQDDEYKKSIEELKEKEKEKEKPQNKSE